MYAKLIVAVLVGVCQIAAGCGETPSPRPEAASGDDHHVRTKPKPRKLVTETTIRVRPARTGPMVSADRSRKKPGRRASAEPKSDKEELMQAMSQYGDVVAQIFQLFDGSDQANEPADDEAGSEEKS